MQQPPHPLKLEPLNLKPLERGSVPAGGRGARMFVPYARPTPPEEAPPPPSFTEDDLKAAERDGFQKGFHEGVKEGRRQVETEQAAVNEQIAAMAAQFAAANRPLFEHYAHFARLLHAEIPKIALAVAKKVAGPALDQNAHLLVADIATRACDSLMTEPRLTITANEALGDSLETMLQGVASRMPEHTEIVILRDPDIPRTDCRIDWKLGTLDHSVAEVWNKVEKAIENLSATAARDGEMQIQQLEQELSLPQLPENPEPEE